MSRKVVIELKSKIIATIEEGISIDDVISEMDYEYIIDVDHGSLEDSEIIGYEVINSK